jgi:transcriptional regulator with XRE-family HTH domain
MIEPKITLKAARVNAELTLDDVAEIIGKSKQSIENWENGKTPIKYSDLLKLSEVYEMPIEYIRIPDGDNNVAD